MRSLAVLDIVGVMARVAALAGALALASPVAHAAVYPGAHAPVVAIEQRLGAQLPLAARFTDASGRAVHLGDYFRADATSAAVPVVLVLGYYHCPNLCETVMESALQALAQSGAAPRDYRVLAISIDPAETVADAAERRRIDLQVAAQSGGAARGDDAREPIALDALIGDTAPIASVANAAGFEFLAMTDERTAAGHGNGHGTSSRAAFAHAAGFLVATPDGRISRYFLGVRHDPAALRVAIDTAAGHSLGRLADELVLLCAHLDPTLGRFSASVMLSLRVGSLLLAAALGLWVWRHRRAPARDAPS